MTIRTSRGKRSAPLWTHIYATEGLGKTTFASKAPGVVLIDVEQGSNEIDVERYLFDDHGRTAPADWDEFMFALRALAEEPNTFQTVAIDTLDAAEPLLWAKICKRDAKKNLDDYGYGKGQKAALEEWRLFVSAIEKLRAPGKHVITIGHSVIKAFQNPEGDSYDRYQLKLDQHAAGLIKEKADVVLFGRQEALVAKGKGELRAKAITGGRTLHTVRTAAYDAKNRHGLPDTLPLDWDDYWSAIQAGRPDNPEDLISEIMRKAAILGGKIEETTRELIKKHAGSATELAQLDNRLNVKLAEREQKESN